MVVSSNGSIIRIFETLEYLVITSYETGYEMIVSCVLMGELILIVASAVRGMPSMNSNSRKKADDGSEVNYNDCKYRTHVLVIRFTDWGWRAPVYVRLVSLLSAPILKVFRPCQVSNHEGSLGFRIGLTQIRISNFE